MMAFTDDDLKRLKKRVADRNRDGLTATWDINALLARLEAAEKLITYSTFNKQESSLFKAWHASKGKEKGNE